MSQIEGVDTLCVFGVQCVGVLFHISDTLPVFCSARPVLMSFVLHTYHLNMIASRPSPEFGFLCDFFDDIIVHSSICTCVEFATFMLLVLRVVLIWHTVAGISNDCTDNCINLQKGLSKRFFWQVRPVSPMRSLQLSNSRNCLPLNSNYCSSHRCCS